MSHPIAFQRHDKPQKPYEGFPLFSHPSGQWAKKYKGRLKYFGSWREDRDGELALQRFNREWPFILKGEPVPEGDVDVTADGKRVCSLKKLCNRFLDSKQGKLDAGNLAARTYRDYHATCQTILDFFGKETLVSELTPKHFGRFRAELSKRLGPVSLRNFRVRVLVLFNWGLTDKLYKDLPHFGDSFDPPPARVIRQKRYEAGKKLFTADEIKRILDAADLQMRAMILLGVNCGFGNTDLSALPVSAMDLEGGWVDYPRPKTGVPRRAKLWPETVQSLQEWLGSLRRARFVRLAATADKGLVFLTRSGRRWVRSQIRKPKEGETETIGPEGLVTTDQLSSAFAKILKSLKINGRRGLGCYTLRHNFRTAADSCLDQVAIASVMGHLDRTMAGAYREGVSDQRLMKVAETVHDWLFPPESAKSTSDTIDGNG